MAPTQKCRTSSTCRARRGTKLLIISDSDIAVSRDYLTTVAASLGQPGVGLVTCLYRGARRDRDLVPAHGGGDRLSLSAERLGRAQSSGLRPRASARPLRLRKRRLRSSAGLQSVADQLADDYGLGMAARRAGLKVAIPPFIVGTCLRRAIGARTVASRNSLGANHPRDGLIRLRRAWPSLMRCRWPCSA